MYVKIRAMISAVKKSKLRDILTGQEMHVYKDDARSRVWRVRVKEEEFVVKRFNHNLIRQLLAWGLRCHPAVREEVMSKRLTKVGLPVVPIFGRGIDSGRGVLATRYVGPQVYGLFKYGVDEVSVTRSVLLEKVADLLEAILRKGFVFRDCKLSNFVWDDGTQAIMVIDAMSFQKTRSFCRVGRMLRVLDETAVRAGWSDVEREKCYRMAGFDLLHVQHCLEGKS